MTFFKKIKQIILKCLWNHSRPWIAKASSQEQIWRHHALDFKLHDKAIVIKTVCYWQKHRHTDQWSRIENPEINPCIHAQLIYNKWGKNMQCGKHSLFNKLSWENWTVVCKKMKLNTYLTSYTKINSKWIKVLNVRPDTIKLLEENIGSKLLDTHLRN